MSQLTAAVVGLGYVGLPLAVLAREKGWAVRGIDISQKRVEQINAQQSFLDDKRLDERLRCFPVAATTDFATVSDASIVVVAVPTPVTENKMPDLEPLVSAVNSLLPHLVAGQTVVIESTINPGVMDEVVVPLLRQRTDLILDADDAKQATLFTLYCPERINPGDATWTVRNIPRVIGGYSAAGVKRALDFYESVIEAPVKVMGSATEAEAVKIMENTFRDVNIAFVNEMAKSFARLNIDITNVIAGAATKPFAFMPHYPGNGVGGHCISVDPYYMIERGRQAGFDHEFLKLARQINDSMPEYVVSLLQQALALAHLKPADSPVALLGLAYKKNVGDLRDSPALTIRRLLTESGAPLRVYDPYVAEQSTVSTLAEALAGAKAVMLATDHAVITEALTPALLSAAGVKVVVDGKNALPGQELADAGMIYWGVGRQYLPVTVPAALAA